jgi:hypothetical protein
MDCGTKQYSGPAQQHRRNQAVPLGGILYNDFSFLLQPPAHAGFSRSDFSTLKMEAIRSSETSVKQDLYGATSQNTAFFIVIAVKISNLTRI